MGVQLRVLLATRLVPELGDDKVLRVLDTALPLRLLAGLGALLGRGEGERHGAVVGLDDARVAADERLERDTLRRREGEIDADAILGIGAPRAPTARTTGRHVAGQELPEPFRVDRTVEPERL